MDAALSSLKQSRDQDIVKAVMGILSVRFTSSASATLSPSYSKDPSKSAGRCYLEIYGLSDFYKRFQTFDDIIRPIQEQAINNYVVCLPLFRLDLFFLLLTYLSSRHVSIGDSVCHLPSRRSSIGHTILSLPQTLRLSGK